MWNRNSCASIGFLALALTLAPSGRGSVKEPPTPSKPIPSLLASSRRILDLESIRDWLGPDGTTGGEAFWDPIWLSPYSVLAHDNFADGAFNEPYRINLKSGVRGRLPKLADEIRRQGYLKPGEWKLSSDRQWLLWRDGWLEKEYSFVATRIDGSRSIRWSPPRASQNAHQDSYFWIPGTHKWINLYSETGDTFASAQMYDLDSPHSFRSISLAPLRISAHFLGRAPDGTIWSANDRDSGGAKRKVTLTSFRLEAPTQVRRYVASAPKDQTVRQLHMSPDGRTLAWLTVSANDSNFTILLSKIDGTGMRTIACQRFENDGGEICIDGWTPDGKGILFDITTNPQAGKSRCELREISVR